MMRSFVSLRMTAMIDSMLLAQAPAGTPPPAQPSLTDALTRDATSLANVPGDVVVPFLQHLAQVMPAADVAFGGGMLLLIVLIHATGVRAVTTHVARRTRVILLRPRIWRADVLLGSSVLMLLA